MSTGAHTQFKMASTIQTCISEMHYTGLTIYFRFLGNVQYVSGSRAKVLSVFFFLHILLFPHRKVNTKWKKRRGDGEYI